MSISALLEQPRPSDENFLFAVKSVENNHYCRALDTGEQAGFNPVYDYSSRAARRKSHLRLDSIKRTKDCAREKVERPRSS